MRLALLSLGLSGCFTVTEDNYAQQFAQAGCDAYFNCDKGTFYHEDGGDYKDVADCVDEAEGDFEDEQEEYEDADCKLDEDQANECLTALRAYGASCSNDAAEDYVDACADADNPVWDCD